MKIKLDDITKVFLQAMYHIKHSYKIDEFENEGQFYWDCSFEDRINPYQDPKLDLGDFDWDIELLKEAVDGESDLSNCQLKALSMIFDQLASDYSFTCWKNEKNKDIPCSCEQKHPELKTTLTE